MKQKAFRLLLGVGASVLMFTMISWSIVVKTTKQNNLPAIAEDTFNLPGVIFHIPSSWKRTAGIGGNFETYLQRSASSIIWNCRYDEDKRGWSWYYDLPLSHWTKMNLDMSLTVRDAEYQNGKKKATLKSYADLKGPYYNSVWQNFTGNIGEAIKTVSDTVMANGNPACFTHVSYLTKSFGNDFEVRLEVWNRYQLLYWSDNLQKPVIFDMTFKIWQYVGQSVTDEKYGQIFLDEVRKKEPEMNEYVSSFLSNLEFK